MSLESTFAAEEGVNVRTRVDRALEECHRAMEVAE
jgi:hypothetical protein